MARPKRNTTANSATNNNAAGPANDTNTANPANTYNSGRPKRNTTTKNANTSNTANIAPQAPQTTDPARRKPFKPVEGMENPKTIGKDGTNIIDDFKGFGWDDATIKAVMGIPERRVDNFMSMPKGFPWTEDEQDRYRDKLDNYLDKVGLRPDRYPDDAYEIDEAAAAQNGTALVNGITDSTSDESKSASPKAKGKGKGKGKKAAVTKPAAAITKTAAVNKLASPRRRKPRKIPRNQIYLYGSDKIVLWDANLPLPANGEEAPPAFMAKYAHFRPGNRKVLAFNLTSKALVLKTTPAEFENREVKYLKTGPQLVEPVEKPSPRGRKRGAEELDLGGDPQLEGAVQAGEEGAGGKRRRVDGGDGEGRESPSATVETNEKRRVLPARATRGKGKPRA